jgi:hypothetical protein
MCEKGSAAESIACAGAGAGFGEALGSLTPEETKRTSRRDPMAVELACPWTIGKEDADFLLKPCSSSNFERLTRGRALDIILFLIIDNGRFII